MILGGPRPSDLAPAHRALSAPALRPSVARPLTGRVHTYGAGVRTEPLVGAARAD